MRHLNSLECSDVDTTSAGLRAGGVWEVLLKLQQPKIVVMKMMMIATTAAELDQKEEDI